MLRTMMSLIIDALFDEFHAIVILQNLVQRSNS